MAIQKLIYHSKGFRKPVWASSCVRFDRYYLTLGSQYIISYATTTDKQSKNSETKAILLLCVPWWNRKLNRHLYCMQKVEKKQKMQRCKRCKKCKREKVKGVKAAKGVTDAKDAKDVKVQKMQKCKGSKKTKGPLHIGAGLDLMVRAKGSRNLYLRHSSQDTLGHLKPSIPAKAARK